MAEARGASFAGQAWKPGLLALVLALIGGGLWSPLPARADGVYDVMAYGAKVGGVADNTVAFAAAIAAAQRTGGGTVSVPAGVFAFTQPSSDVFGASIRLHGSVPVSLVGAGRGISSLVEHVPGQTLLSVHADHSVVEGLTLDTQSFDGGTAVGVQANYTTVQMDQVLGGDKAFALYYIGPGGATPSAPLYDVGNQVAEMVIVDDESGDGFSFAFQQDAAISNVTHLGSRLALYVDAGVTVTNYYYTPNPLCGGAQNGFYITSPSEDVTITNFTTAGAGGVIGNGSDLRSSSRISIIDERFTSPAGFHLEVGNVNGLTIDGGSFNAANSLYVDPPVSATGVLVEATTVPAIRFAGSVASTISGTFDQDTFPALSLSGLPAPTFQEATALGSATIAINGGSWSNQAGGFVKGTSPTFSINGLAGVASTGSPSPGPVASPGPGAGAGAGAGDGSGAGAGLVATSCPPPSDHPGGGTPQSIVASSSGRCGGYWMATREGKVVSFGDASPHGDLSGVKLNRPVIGMASTFDHGGYWLLGGDGGIFSFGDAVFYGSTGGLHLNAPVIAMAATSDGRGYWLVAADGGIFAFGDAGFHGSAGGLRLNQAVVGIAPMATGQGYWLVASDGGIFSYGAPFLGSLGSTPLNQPIVGMTADPAGRGYRMVAGDGGIFSYGAPFLGSLGGSPPAAPVVSMAPSADGNGYYLLGRDGEVFAFGDAPYLGRLG